MEQIIVEGLEVFGYHGVYEQEKEEGQIFVVNCWIDTSFAGAIHSDDLSNTVDYGNVCLFIKKYFAQLSRISKQFRKIIFKAKFEKARIEESR